MILDQPTLRHLLVHGALARGYTAADLQALPVRRSAPDDASAAAALVILSGFSLPEFVQGTAEFVARLDPGARADWYRDFTRTRFLVGDPDRIATRFGELLAYRTQDIAWVSPATAATDLMTLRRLLKPLRTAGCHRAPRDEACTLVLNPEMVRRSVKEVQLATRGLPLEQYLVHLNHTLCDGLIRGTLAAPDLIVLREVASIEQVPSGCIYVRVVPDVRAESELKAMSYISVRDPEQCQPEWSRPHEVADDRCA